VPTHALDVGHSISQGSPAGQAMVIPVHASPWVLAQVTPQMPPWHPLAQAAGHWGGDEPDPDPELEPDPELAPDPELEPDPELAPDPELEPDPTPPSGADSSVTLPPHAASPMSVTSAGSRAGCMTILAGCCFSAARPDASVGVAQNTRVFLARPP